MIIYNVTIKVESGIAEEWLKWLSEEHIPEVIETGCFHQAKILRLLEADDAEGPTFAVQYSAKSREDYNHYIEHFAAALREKSFQRWGNRFIAFRTLMEVVN